jgi:hypothetical protein
MKKESKTMEQEFELMAAIVQFTAGLEEFAKAMMSISQEFKSLISMLEAVKHEQAEQSAGNQYH